MSAAPAFRLEDIGFEYVPGRPVLHGLDLEIRQGRVTALMGPNGAGKSTLLGILALDRLPTRGRLRAFGEPATDERRAALRKRIGFLPQDAYLFRGSALDNVATGLRFRGVGRRERRRRALECLEGLGLTAWAERPVRDLSGGQRQRVAIARLLVLHPEVLLLDEPFAWLDTRSSREIEDLARGIREQGIQTLVFTTHDRLRAGLLADRVYHLESGRLVEGERLNLFHGVFNERDATFDTGRLRIHLPQGAQGGERLTVEPSYIVLSLGPLDSSMRNAFLGRVTGLAEEGAGIRVTVDCGEIFQAMVTREALDALQLAPGKPVWASFKASAVTLI